MSGVHYQFPRHGLFWLLIAQAMVISVHLQRMPSWIIGAWVFCILWRLAVFYGHTGFPGAIVRIGLVVTSCVAIFGEYGSFIGLEPTVALLICAYLLKLLEMHAKRDVLILSYLSYFVIVTQLLFEQGIPSGLYMFVSVVFVTAALIAQQESQRHRFFQPLQKSLLMVAQAVPLLVIMFLVFPRLAPFWSVPLPGHQAKTGMSDVMSPGEVTKLAQSSSVAFRVSFEGEIPQNRDLYWRGMVLTDFDGRTWSRGKTITNKTTIQNYRIMDESRVLRYDVIMEPTYRPWLYTLPIALIQDAGARDDDIRYTINQTVSVTDNISQRFSFSASSYPEYYQGIYRTRNSHKASLALPEKFNPRAREFAQQLRLTVNSDRDYVDAVLHYFNQQSFFYTLEPPTLGEHSIDEFLFQTRRGFCEHYSSAFVFLMRAAGIPARVIVGYQGGSRSPFDRYLIVRQLDAHAWAEVWLSGEGWVRVDPTAAVAPQRIEQGSVAALQDDVGFLEDDPFSPLRFKNLSWLLSLQLRLDQLNYLWSRFVLGYDSQLQFSTLKSLLGDVSPGRIAIVFVISAAIVMALVALQLFITQRKPRVSPVVKIYLRFCRKVAKKVGVKRRVGEGAHDYAQRVIKSRPDLTTPVTRITDLFNELQYAGYLDSTEARDDEASHKDRSASRRRGRQLFEQFKAEVRGMRITRPRLR